MLILRLFAKNKLFGGKTPVSVKSLLLTDRCASLKATHESRCHGATGSINSAKSM